MGLLLLLVGCKQDYGVSKELSELVVTPTLSDLGALAVGQTATAEIALSHASGAEIRVIALELRNLDGDYYTTDVDHLPVVPKGGMETLTVDYLPTEAGFHRAELLVYTDEDEGGVHTVTLRGVAAEPALEIWPLVLDFGPVDAGDTGTRSLSLANPGSVDWVVDAMSFGGGASFAGDDSIPLTVPAGASATLDVTFSPRTEDPARGELELSIPGLAAPTVLLRGNACEEGDPSLYDTDEDGWSTCAEDCEDGDDSAHPGGVEVCDGVDQDCDGVVDDGTSCADDDGDGSSEDDGDCNDGDPTAHPGATEDESDGVDNDCDGVVDLGADDPDRDGYSVGGGDCDESDRTAYPGAPELPDGVDNDCDGTVDEGTDAYDDDGDGVTEDGGDCDDSDRGVYPGATESGNGTDDDCDGALDEGTTWADDDADGWSERGGDCDDTNRRVNPGTPEETGDGIDNDCDGVTS